MTAGIFRKTPLNWQFIHCTVTFMNKQNMASTTEIDIKKQIFVKNAHLNNLKHIDVLIPKNKLIVITGVSGSGKSSLAFDTIYAEGQKICREFKLLCTSVFRKIRKT
jgi:excinuclease ABC subunit A